MSADIVRFDGVRRRFDHQVVLNGLDFRLNQGEVYALLGRNGTGKTTALRILMGFLEPHAGTTTIFGRDSRHLRPDDRDRIGYIGEGHRLHHSMTARGLIDFEAATRPSFDRKEALEMLGRCGLPQKKGVLFLSRGQRAQLALILAVAARPELLICDDPALGLDVVKRRELLDAIIDFLSERGGTVLFSSHILSDVERIADRIGILDQGALIVDAPLSELKERVRLRRWQPRDGQPLPEDDRVLRSRPVRDGFDLLLRDDDASLQAALQARGLLSEPQPLTLEEFFIALTGGDSSLLPSLDSEEIASC
ncbi:MAG: ABC transporter ATP-binding protein [Planctomycetes bacterium]|nr:ABC transporter ATP-binding protein [Planctomycetota bacterium]